MVRRFVVVVCWLLIAAFPSYAQRATASPPSTGPSTSELLTDAAIILLIIAASTAAYKAMGKPCACPDDMLANGRRCGGNSAYLKPNGYKPLCSGSDITSSMIAAYRSSKIVPALR